MCLSQITSGYKYPVLDQLNYQNNFGLISFRPTNVRPSEQIVYVIKAITDVISKDGRHHKPTSLHSLAN